MADFPTTIYTERETQNLPGIVYDPTQKQNLFAEDFQHHAAEIISIETILGLTPNWASASIAERIKGIRSLSDADEGVITIKGANVGIGTTGPRAELDVNGNFFSKNFGISAPGGGYPSAGYNIKGSVPEIANSFTYAVSDFATAIRYDSEINFLTAGSGTAGNAITLSPKVTIQNGGNVGIGTTNPGTKLVVAGPDDGTMQIRMMGTTAPTYYWEMGRESASIGDFRIKESVAGSVSDRFIIKTGTGNVGIGTTGPLNTLDVMSSAGTSTIAVRQRLDTAGNNAQVLLQSSAGITKGGMIGNNNNGEIRFGAFDAGGYFPTFYSNNAEAMRILTNGNVGIATTSPTAKLDILSDILRLRTAKTPASAGAAGNQGDMCWDSGFLYICVLTNAWVRSALATW